MQHNTMMGPGNAPLSFADSDDAEAIKAPILPSENRPLPLSTPTNTTSPVGSTSASTSLQFIAPATSLTPDSLPDNSCLLDASGGSTEHAPASSTATATMATAATAASSAVSSDSSASSAPSGTGLQPSSPAERPATEPQTPAAPNATETATVNAAGAGASMTANTTANFNAPNAHVLNSSTPADQRRMNPSDNTTTISPALDSANPGPSPHITTDTRGPRIDADKPQRVGPGVGVGVGAGAGRGIQVINTGSPSTPGQAPESHGNGDNENGHDSLQTAHMSSAPTATTSALTEQFPPLHTSSVLPGTKIAQPKPITLPSPSSTNSPPLNHHNHRTSEQFIRGSAFFGNVAQLEATAERLSTGTSSIGDAIKELHGELKRSDSRRSSILAASVRAAQNEDQSSEPLPAPGPLKRHLSNASSIVATNIAARHGGYSPGGFVMSPNHSLTGRLRSGSKNSSGRPEIDMEPALSRHGPGKASVRSVRSNKMSLAEISESEPISLTTDALDAADAAPPIEDDEYDTTIRPTDTNNASGTGAFHQMLEGGYQADVGRRASAAEEEKVVRTASVRSIDTYQQARDAFIDFDGVHWEPEPEQYEPPIPLTQNPDFPTTYLPPADMPRPQSYLDPATGQRMLYYPARVPAMLNLPPKLSSRPKAEEQQKRRSKVLSAMVDANIQSEEPQARRKSGMPSPSKRDSFLPDPLAGHRGSFIALSQDPLFGDEKPQSLVEAGTSEPANESTPLRRPQRLSRNEPDERKAKQSRSSHLPPQLRASAFFDMPSGSVEMEVKDGSAMATLESMLDASTNAPVSAFTGHQYGAKLGDETYSKEKKHKSKLSTSSLRAEPVIKEPKKKRSSRSWFKRRSSHSEREAPTSPSALGDVHLETDAPETEHLARSDGSGSVHQPDADDQQQSDEEDSDSEAALDGPPTTLLAELQIRKHQAKQRTQPRAYGQASHMTLLEMDAVAETQRKHRQTKRVNLAWEDPNAHADQNGSDDEDVPLAIIAAKHAGAKNMADLDRPLGLMERRDMEDNEPLSQRRARLQGHVPVSMVLPHRQSVANLSTHLGGHVRTPSDLPRSQAVTPEPEEPEIEEETLGDRKRRLESKELPQARPVSSAFSAELLSQFGDLEDKKLDKENLAPSPGEEVEETLGQRRRRLQAEREARDREMSYNSLVGNGEPAVTRRLSMADMLAAHPKRESDNRLQSERARMEQEQFAARDRDNRMAAFRMQMPSNLAVPNVERSGGFRSGVYNDGLGGIGGQAIHSTSAINTQGLGMMPKHNRSTTAVSVHGMQMPQTGYGQVPYYGGAQMGAAFAPMRPALQTRNTMQLPMQMPMDMAPQLTTASMKRVDQWRHGVMP